MKKDIETRKDIELLIQDFYKELQTDELIGFIFTEIVPIDLESHIPIICDFWESVLLNNPVYKGNVMHKHIDLDKKVKLLPAHFDRWVGIFFQHATRLYEGPVTEELIRRVNLMKPFMQFKVERSRGEGFIY